jgi:hypothetical protein
MAGPYAIAAIGQAILGVLEAAVPPEFSGADFQLYNAPNFQKPMDEGISLYLYRVVPANNIRSPGLRVGPNGQRYRPSLPIDFQFLMIAWARNAFKQQRLLGWAMRVLEDNTILHASLLNQYGPENDTFSDRECVDVILETLSIQDLHSIWDVTKPNIQPAAAYIVRMLRIDSTIEFSDAELAQTRVFGMGKVAEP